jgi:hypothetical protein
MEPYSKKDIDFEYHGTLWSKCTAFKHQFKMENPNVPGAMILALTELKWRGYLVALRDVGYITNDELEEGMKMVERV